MTPAQLNKYRAEWGLCRRVFRKAGLSPPAADAKRHELHRKALGHDKSSLEFTNADFDAVLAVFSAISRPDDLRTQLRLQEQAPMRLQKLEARAGEFLERLAVEGWGRVAYLDHLSRKVCGRGWERLGEVERVKIVGILSARARAKPPAAEVPF